MLQQTSRVQQDKRRDQGLCFQANKNWAHSARGSDNQFLQSISSKNSSLSIGKDVGPGFYRVSGSVLFVVASLGTKLLIGALGSQTFQNSVLLSNTTCGRGSDTY